MDSIIFIAQISLHYQERPTVIHQITREKYARMKAEKKSGKEYQDWYFERVTFSKAKEIEDCNFRQDCLNKYDRAIQEKYNVGPGWQQNRWFVEQVRPAI